MGRHPPRRGGLGHRFVPAGPPPDGEPAEQAARDQRRQLFPRQLGFGGDFAMAYVLAHEYGHHVQNLLGVLGRAQQGAQGATGNGVRTELQADCYAGVWAHYAAITKQPGTDVTFLQPLSDKDIADALSAASSVGDDRIQKQSTGRVNPESWTHGSSAERQAWFTIGYQTGDPNKCDTYHARDLDHP